MNLYMIDNDVCVGDVDGDLDMVDDDYDVCVGYVIR